MGRGLLPLAAAALCLAQDALPPPVPATTNPDLCVIEGAVTNAVTGEALAGVAITLSKTTPPKNTTEVNLLRGALSTQYKATTDADGKYVLPDIEPGAYRIRATLKGFIGLDYGARKARQSGTAVYLALRQRMTGLNIKLPPETVISGRVLDENKQPVPHVNVMALISNEQGGNKKLRPLAGAMTDAHGEYRLPLPVGRYYLAAIPGPQPSATPAGQEPTQPVESYVPSYYSGTTDPLAASPIEIYGSSELPGLDLVLAKAPTFRVRGRIVNHTGDVSKERVRVALRSDSISQFAGSEVVTIADSEGRFQFLGVTAGRYDLLAAFNGENIKVIARQPVSVDRKEVADVLLPIGAGMEVRGQVKVEDSEKLDLASLTVMLSQDGQYGGMTFPHEPAEKVNPDGTFVLSHVSPNHYVFHIAGLPDGFYIKSVYMLGASVDAMEDGLDLMNGAAAPITAVISNKAGMVNALVTNDDSKPVVGATVALVPESPKRKTRPRYYEYGTTDAQGRVTLKNLQPSDYRIYAWDSIEFRQWMDLEFMAQFQSKGKQVTIAPNARQTVDLKVLVTP